MTLAAWADLWLSLYVEPSGIRPSTMAMYRRAIRAIPSDLTDCELEQLRPVMILSWLRKVERTHPRAAQLDRMTILQMLHKAYLCRELTFDLSPDALPKAKHHAKETACLSPDQLRQYVAGAAAFTGRAWPALLLCCCGLRRGEALGVRREDLSGCALQITRQRINGHAAPLKTANSRRTIILPEQIAEQLRNAPRTRSGYLTDVKPSDLYAAHRSALAALGLPAVTLHGLRHSLAVSCAASGMAPAMLRQLLGHTDIRLTMNLYANHPHELPSPTLGALTLLPSAA